MSTHAKYMQPSGSKKWINCAMSPVHESQTPDDGENRPADEGTVAHALSELALVVGRDIEQHLDERAEVSPTGDVTILEEGVPANDLNRLPHRITKEMVWHVKNYVATVKSYVEPGDDLKIEHRMKLDTVTGEAGAGGTSDIVIVKGDKSAFQIHDLKYGYINVFPKNNWQLMIYALALAYEQGFITFDDMSNTVVHDMDVKLVIHQPRDFRVSEWDTTLAYLAEWHDEVLIPAANKVIAAVKGTHKEYNAGAYCQYCRHSIKCEAFLAHVTKTGNAVAVELGDPGFITEGMDLVKFYTMIPALRTLIGKVEAEVMTKAMDGEHIPGFVLGEGRAGNRAWKALSEKELTGFLRSSGVPSDRLYETRIASPSGISKLVKEKLLTKEAWAEIEAEVVTRSDPQPKLLPDTSDAKLYQLEDKLEGFD